MEAVALKEAGASWESVGQGVRSAVDEVKAMEGFKGSPFPTHSPDSQRVEEKKTVGATEISAETSALEGHAPSWPQTDATKRVPPQEEESGETSAENASPDEDAASDSPATDSADLVTPPTQTLTSPMGQGSPRAGAKPLLSPKPMSRRPGEKPDDRKNLRGNSDKE